jgi:hypothetical protein
LSYWTFHQKMPIATASMPLPSKSLRETGYTPIIDGRSEPLKLRLQVEDQLIGFYREDTGEKLLIPEELAAALAQERVARQQAEDQVERLKTQLRLLGVDPDTL